MLPFGIHCFGIRTLCELVVVIEIVGVLALMITHGAAVFLDQATESTGILEIALMVPQKPKLLLMCVFHALHQSYSSHANTRMHGHAHTRVWTVNGVFHAHTLHALTHQML